MEHYQLGIFTHRGKWRRSGDYQQGRYRLRDGVHHCCLGVLCEVALAEGVELEEVKRGVLFEFDGSNIWLPEAVREWAGMRSNTGEFKPEEEEESLMGLNDSGWTFEGIAKVIEAKWEDL